MWKNKLCLNLMKNGISELEQISLYRDAGFEGFFVSWRDGVDLMALRQRADELGMLFQSVHAPFTHAADLWRDSERAEAALGELMRCLEEVAAARVGIMVCHAWIGFDTPDVPNASGVEYYRRLVLRASELGVRIAFENTEGEEFLAALLNAFAEYPSVGFCLDTGHETCYNGDRDLLALYGDRLIATHINDNLGVKDFGGKITFKDDLHLLPFDGVKDWENFAERICRHGYTGELTFEMNLTSKPGRHENDAYAEMPFERYLSEMYKRACRVATLVQRARDKGNRP